MTGEDSQVGRDEGASRRRFLAGVGTVTGIALAGCSGLTDQSFAASPVVLPEGDQTEMRLSETARDSETVTLSGPADSEVEITNHATTYSRAKGIGGK